MATKEMTLAEAERAVARLRAAADAEISSLAAPWVANTITRRPCADSSNGKPWHGTTDQVTVTIDGRKYRVNLLVTDVQASAALKK